MLAASAAIEGERKQVTVMFADIKGSMDLSRSVGVEQWWTLMQQFFSLVCDGVNRYGGWVNQFTGDGVMAVFGAPRAIEDHARRACHAALWTRGELERYAAELQRERGLALAVRMGLNSGEVVAGTIGEQIGSEYTTIGHAAGLAQRMESLAAPGGVYLTESTAKLVRGFFTLAERGEMDVKGAAGPMRVFELTGDEGLHTAFAVSRAGGLSPLVGREQELGVLEDALKGAVAGRGQVIALVAPAGVGKSRLCFEFSERCRAEGVEVWQGHALAHTSAVPFVPALEILRDYFRIAAGDGDEEARRKVLARLSSIGVELGDALPLLLDLLGISDPGRLPAYGDPEARQRRLFSALNSVVRANGDLAPSVVVVEDLHWIDSASAALVENLVAGVHGTRTLLLATYRPEYHARWVSLPYCRELRLQPLDRDASRLLLADLLGSDRSLDGLGELVYEHADGNPFFIEEIVKTLAESDTLTGARGAYRLTRTVQEVQIPTTVESVLAARIDRLAEHEKTTLQAASVIGRQFSEPVLRHVAGLSERELEDGLRGLLEAELIFPGPGQREYRHKHALAERVAYGSQLSDSRARRHAAVARAIAETGGERLDELAALIAGHWERAGDPLQAAQWCARAASWAGVNDPNEALRQWRRACTLADAAGDSPDSAPLALGTRIAVLNLAWRLGVPDGETRDGFAAETAALYEHAIALARAAGDGPAETLTLAAYGAVRGIGGHLEDMAELGMRAVALADTLGDRALKLSILPAAVYGLFALGRYGEIGTLLERELPDLPEDPEEAVGGMTLVCPYAWVLCWRAAAQAQTGELGPAFAGFERALLLARKHGDFETESWIQMSIVQAMELAGGGRDALVHAREAREIAERTGGAFSVGLAWRYLGIAHLLRAEWREAIEALDRALATWRPRQVGLEAEPQALTMLARAHLGLGDATTALDTAEEAVALAVVRDTKGYELEARLALVEVLRTVSGPDAAAEIEGHLRAAGDLVAVTGARTLEPRVHAELAELARLRGDEAARERELLEARRLFEQVGAPALAERAVLYTG
jgi:adenylate cyclase